MEEKFITKHPDPTKQGVNISKAKYDQIRTEIIALLKANGEMPAMDLYPVLNQKLKGSFDGSISWYVVSVKLDLEARNIIERVPKSKPHRIRLK